MKEADDLTAVIHQLRKHQKSHQSWLDHYIADPNHTCGRCTPEVLAGVGDAIEQEISVKVYDGLIARVTAAQAKLRQEHFCVFCHTRWTGDGVTEHCGDCHRKFLAARELPKEWRAEIDESATKDDPYYNGVRLCLQELENAVLDMGEPTESGDRICPDCNQQVPSSHRCANRMDAALLGAQALLRELHTSPRSLLLYRSAQLVTALTELHDAVVTAKK